MPYSGPYSVYGQIGKAEQAYFAKVNAEGGINGRKVELISLDDGYVPPKALEQTRRLVEQEQVALIFNGLGTPSNAAVHAYLNDSKVPQLFVATGAAMWGDPKNFPWTIGFQPNYQTEATIFGKHILATKPDAKIGVLGVNGAGKSTLLRIMAGLDTEFNGEAWVAEGARVVLSAPHEATAAAAAGPDPGPAPGRAAPSRSCWLLRCASRWPAWPSPTGCFPAWPAW